MDEIECALKIAGMTIANVGKCRLIPDQWVMLLVAAGQWAVIRRALSEPCDGNVVELHRIDRVFHPKLFIPTTTIKRIIIR